MSPEPSPLNRAYLICLVILLVVALNIGLTGVFNRNLLLTGLTKLTTNPAIIRAVYIVIGLIAIYLIFFVDYHTFLPFLDKTVLPPSVLLLSERPDTNVNIEINAGNASKVVYWAAHADKGVVEKDPWVAYGEYENIGIAAVENGKALLKLKCPTAYKVPKHMGLGNKQLPKHLHYRLVYDNGVLSEIKTVKLNDKC